MKTTDAERLASLPLSPTSDNAGRDALVSAAIKGGQFGDRIWKADVEWIQGLLPRGRDGINHDIEIDGMTAVLTVQSEW